MAAGNFNQFPEIFTEGHWAWRWDGTQSSTQSNFPLNATGLQAGDADFAQQAPELREDVSGPAFNDAANITYEDDRDDANSTSAVTFAATGSGSANNNTSWGGGESNIVSYRLNNDTGDGVWTAGNAGAYQGTTQLWGGRADNGGSDGFGRMYGGNADWAANMPDPASNHNSVNLQTGGNTWQNTGNGAFNPGNAPGQSLPAPVIFPADTGSGGTPGADGPPSSGAPGPAGSLQTLANYLKTGYWSDMESRPGRYYNIDDNGSGANWGNLYYNVDGFSSSLSTIYGTQGADSNGLTAARSNLVRDAFDVFEEVLGINFIETTSTAGYVDFFFKDNGSGNYAASQMVSGNGGPIDYTVINIPTSSITTVLHEIGHALGLGHQGPYNGGGVTYAHDALFANDSDQLTLMSYFSQGQNTTINASTAAPQTPMSVDWLALDDLYRNQDFGSNNFGLNNAFNGNTTYGFNTNISTGVSELYADLANVASTRAFTIVDGSGNDTVDFSGFANDQLINLGYSSASSTGAVTSNIGGLTGNMTLAVGTVIENAISGSGDDDLYGNAAANRLTGGQGADTVKGLGGNDRLIFNSGDIAFGNESIDGGADTDTIVVSRSGAGLSYFDFRGSDIGSIEEIEFNADGSNVDKIARFDANQFGGSGISDSALIDGNANAGANDSLRVYMGTETVFSMAAWTFQDWNDTADSIWVLGDSSNETITGSTRSDQLYGYSGNDTLIGGLGGDYIAAGNGDDTIRFNTGDILIGGESFFGQAGTDRLFLSGSSGANGYDFRGSTVGSIEEIEFRGGSANVDKTASFDAIQFGGSGFSDSVLIDGNNVTGSDDVIAIYMGVDTNLDISGWTFQDWGGQDELIAVVGDASNETIVGTSQEDYILGDAGNDNLTGGQGADIVKGGAGNDRLWFNDSDISFGNEVINGDAGTDAIVVSRSGGTGLSNYDFRGSTLGSIEEIEFFGDGVDVDKSVFFNADQFGGTGISNSVLIDGSNVIDADDVVYVYMGTETSFSMAGWTFVDWGGQNDQTVVFGDANSEIITGSTQSDQIFGNGGNDTLTGGLGGDMIYAGAGDDTIRFDTGDISVGNEVIVGQDGTDRIFLVGSTGSNGYDFRGSVIQTMEEIEFGADGANVDKTAYFDASQFGGLGISDSVVIDGNNSTGSDDVIVVDMGLRTSFDMSGWTFVDWGGQDELISVVGDGDDETITGSSQIDSIFGNGGRDTISGGAGDDTIRGGAGDDILLQGDDGNDTIYGGDGDDLIRGGDGDDTLLDGNAGSDTIYGGGGDDIIRGGGGDDILLQGNAGNDTIYGDSGNDIIRGGGGEDTAYGGDGNDTIYGDTGNDILLQGNAGRDTIYGGDGDDLIRGGGGSDFLLQGNAGNDTIYGDGGNDIIRGGDGDDTVYGGFGNDTIYGDPGNDTLLGDAGNDTIYGGGGSDEIRGGDGDDILLQGYAGNDTIYGDDGNDTIRGGGDDDTAYGGIGDDFIFGDSGDDVLEGNAGLDTIYGGAGDDEIRGGSGDDTLQGSGGLDTIYGGTGNDQIYGGDGDDILLQGNAGIDTVNGGLGNDLIRGGDGDDFLYGVGGDDTIWGDQGSDSINGGAGFDIAQFNGLIADYSIINNSGGSWLVTQISSGDIDTLTSIEQLQYDDGMILV